MGRRLALAAVALAAAGCSGKDETAPGCDPAGQTGCAVGQFCERVGSVGAACFAPVAVVGAVVDPTGTGTTPIAGARVVALDANRAPVSSVAVSSASGAYELQARAARDESGRPVSASITLRADARGYQTFPGGIRPALPVDLSTAASVNGRWVVSGPLTALALLPLGGAATAALHGTAARPPSGQAPLVVAEPVGGGPGLTGIADRDGSWAVYNLTPGTSYVVTAYAKGANYVPSLATASLDPGANVTVQPLALAAPATATIAGNLIFNNGASPPMQVSLVVDSTYVTTLDRGESPPGLTADVAAGAGGYALTGVPDGRYVVLAAFGRDGKVRDVSGTGNTTAPRVTVSGGSLQGAPPGFKIVPAVGLDAIGGAASGADPVLAVTTATPRFAWTRGSVDAQADVYRLLVFDAFGNTTWSHDEPATASAYSVAYAGAPLRVGTPYQLRILAIKQPAEEQLSQTEDVVGVFTYRP